MVVDDPLLRNPQGMNSGSQVKDRGVQDDKDVLGN
jgi:hypothetical protein